jgi:transposase
MIHIQTKKNDGNRYATFCPVNRRHGGKDIYLGTVIDELNGIFYNRKQGYFKFTIEGGKTELSRDEIEYLELIKKNNAVPQLKKLTIDFGDTWFLDYIMTKSGLKELFSRTCSEDADTLLSLISFKLLNNETNFYAERWWEGNYARYLYPNARLQSQRISEFLEKIGKEEVKRIFFDLYVPYLKAIPGVSDNVLIDSTGLPNDIHFEYSALSNHNGVISKEVRLIYVVERNTGIPVFFRYVAGNIVDVSTLIVTVNILKAQGIHIQHSILDAGYSCEKNLKKLLKLKIPFLTRLSDNSKTQKYVKEHGHDVFNEKYSFKYGERWVFMKRHSYDIDGNECYAYIGIDFERQHDEQGKYLNKRIKGKQKKKNKILDEMGYFVLASSEKMEPKEVLPLYYMRQNIEQTFDHAKNDVDLIPLCSNKLETFRGHLLLCFMATIVLLILKQRLRAKKKLEKLCPKMVLRDMRYIKSEVYPKTLVMTEGSKYTNLILNELKLEAPEVISLIV